MKRPRHKKPKLSHTAISVPPKSSSFLKHLQWSGEFPSRFTLRDELEKVSAPAHIALLYQTQKEWRQGVAAFIAIGLKRKEKCLYISSAHSATHIRACLKKEGVAVPSAERLKQLHIASAKQFFLKNGSFNPNNAIHAIAGEIKKAVSDGFSALRIAQEMDWLKRFNVDVRKFLQYATKTNCNLLPKYPCITLCQLDTARTPAPILKTALMTHPAIITDNHLIDNFYCLSPEDILKRRPGEQEVEFWLKNLEQYRNCQSRLYFLNDIMEKNSRPFLAFYPDGQIMSFNPAFHTMTGYSEKELERKNLFTDFTPAKWRKSETTALQKISAARAPLSYEKEFVLKNGSSIPVEVFTHCVGFSPDKVHYFYSIITDISERKRIQETVKESERFLANIFSSIQDGISILDSNLNIMRVNPIMEQWYSHAMPLVGKKCYEAYHLRTRPCEICPSRKTIETGKTAVEIVPMTGPGGKVVGWLELHSFPLMDMSTGQLKGVIEYVRDITDRKKLEAQLMRSQKMEAISRLVGGVAHDFNNLLTPIINHAIFVKNTLPQKDRAYEDIEIVIKAAQRAAELTRQLMTFSKGQPGNPQIVDINSTLFDMQKILDSFLGKNIELKIMLAENLGLTYIDKIQFEQVIVNLIVNANDAMPDGGKLTIQTSNATLTEDDAARHLNLKPGKYIATFISDTGKGMPDEVKKHLFEPFFTTKEKFKGTGLGLATCYSIVRQYHGDMLVESEKGQGTNFRIFLPRIAKDAYAKCPVEPQPPQPAQPDKEKIKNTSTILVVDNEPLVLNVITRILRENNYTVLEANNGKEALQLAKLNPDKKIDLLITDLVMPEMNGKELDERLRKSRPDIKTIFISAYSENNVNGKGKIKADQVYIQKPFSSAELLQKVIEALNG